MRTEVEHRNHIDDVEDYLQNTTYCAAKQGVRVKWRYSDYEGILYILMQGRIHKCRVGIAYKDLNAQNDVRDLINNRIDEIISKLKEEA